MNQTKDIPFYWNYGRYHQETIQQKYPILFSIFRESGNLEFNGKVFQKLDGETVGVLIDVYIGINKLNQSITPENIGQITTLIAGSIADFRPSKVSVKNIPFMYCLLRIFKLANFVYCFTDPVDNATVLQPITVQKNEIVLQCLRILHETIDLKGKIGHALKAVKIFLKQDRSEVVEATPIQEQDYIEVLNNDPISEESALLSAIDQQIVVGGHAPGNNNHRQQINAYLPVRPNELEATGEDSPTAEVLHISPSGDTILTNNIKGEIIYNAGLGEIVQKELIPDDILQSLTSIVDSFAPSPVPMLADFNGVFQSSSFIFSHSMETQNLNEAVSASRKHYKEPEDAGEYVQSHVCERSLELPICAVTYHIKPEADCGNSSELDDDESICFGLGECSSAATFLTNTIDLLKTQIPRSISLQCSHIWITTHLTFMALRIHSPQIIMRIWHQK